MQQVRERVVQAGADAEAVGEDGEQEAPGRGGGGGLAELREGGEGACEKEVGDDAWPIGFVLFCI